jgi:hypothetical protein
MSEGDKYEVLERIGEFFDGASSTQKTKRMQDMVPLELLERCAESKMARSSVARRSIT